MKSTKVQTLGAVA